MARQKEDTRTRQLQLHASPGAKRQAELKARREADGFKRTTLWIRQDDYNAGFDAAELGRPITVFDCPPGSDLTSWMLGYCWGLQRKEGIQT